MRKIEREMIQSIVDGKSMKKDNTRTAVGHTTVDVYLHENKIAVYYINSQTLHINNCGYETTTTKSRINALLEFVCGGTHRVFQKDFNWYLSRGDKVTPFVPGQWHTV